MEYRINYSRVISQANSIEDNAAELYDKIRALEELESDCRANWSGQAADAFIKQINALQAEMEKTRKQMYSLASTIKRCAERIRQEDYRARQRAKALKTGL